MKLCPSKASIIFNVNSELPDKVIGLDETLSNFSALVFLLRFQIWRARWFSYAEASEAVPVRGYRLYSTDPSSKRPMHRTYYLNTRYIKQPVATTLLDGEIRKDKQARSVKPTALTSWYNGGIFFPKRNTCIQIKHCVNDKIISGIRQDQILNIDTWGNRYSTYDSESWTFYLRQMIFRHFKKSEG